MSRFRFRTDLIIEADLDDYEGSCAKAERAVEFINGMREVQGAGVRLETPAMEPEQLEETHAS